MLLGTGSPGAPALEVPNSVRPPRNMDSSDGEGHNTPPCKVHIKDPSKQMPQELICLGTCDTL